MKITKLNKREAVNIILWAVFFAAIFILAVIHLYLACWWQYALTGIIAILMSRVVVIIINAWIFNWAFKKFFDKWFNEK